MCAIPTSQVADVKSGFVLNDDGMLARDKCIGQANATMRAATNRCCGAIEDSECDRWPKGDE